MSRVKDERIPLLEVKDSVKDFPGVRALDKVSFDLYAGEVLNLQKVVCEHFCFITGFVLPVV